MARILFSLFQLAYKLRYLTEYMIFWVQTFLRPVPGKVCIIWGVSHIIYFNAGN